MSEITITVASGSTVRLKTAGKYCKQDILVSSTFTPSDESAPIYEGPYVSVPGVDEQILNTKNKIMADNVTIQKIPYFEVTNNSGGTTASIGNLEV